MKINLQEDAAELRAFVADAVKKYATKHTGSPSAKRHPLATRFDLNYWLTDGGPAAPFVLLNIDTRPGSNPDGTWTHPKFASQKLPRWKAPLRAVLDGEKVELILPDGSVSTLKAAKLEKVFGEFLVTVLKSVRSDGVFEALPKAERCELGVEESGGSFAWPIYKDRGKDNLA